MMLTQLRIYIIIILLLLCAAPVVMAQDACPTIANLALDAVDTLCEHTGRNQLCYGHVLLVATPYENVTTFSLEQPGDIVNLMDVQDVRLTPMNLEDATWGIALMRIQANLPNTLPGQNVTFLLFGDVEITNAVKNVTELPVQAISGVNVRLQPTTNADNVITTLSRGQEVIANGRLVDGSWIRIKLENNDNYDTGWVAADFLQSTRGDFNTLSVVEGETHFGPMQSFYFRTGIGDSPCVEAPDSGMIIQTPQGVGSVELTANGVDIVLGSMVYLQAADDIMTVAVVEGQANLTVQGVSQLVPAGSSSNVPLDENGIADGAPEFPKPYAVEELSALPIASNLLKTVEITPALSEAEIEEEIQKAAPPFVAGVWTVTGFNETVPSADCPEHTVTPFNGSVTVEPSDDYSSVTLGGTTSYPRTGPNMYSFSTEDEEGTLEAFLIFTSPTTLAQNWAWYNREPPCSMRGEMTGTADEG